MLISHPLSSRPSQVSKPAVQVSIWHAPVAHVALALAGLQVRPQARQ